MGAVPETVKPSKGQAQEIRPLTGNEAIALSFTDSGGVFASGYPGTPSTETLEEIARLGEVYCEWAPNEKVAVEVAIGASMGGVRALAAMKHVGVNVAADPIFTASYTGVRGGLVIVTADDPELHSSQNEQDNRHYAVAAKIPMLEPSDSFEAKEFTRLAFELSEKYDTPVFLRTTTRISHAKGVVRLEEPTGPAFPPGFTPDPAKWVMLPVHGKRRHVVVEERRGVHVLRHHGHHGAPGAAVPAGVGGQQQDRGAQPLAAGERDVLPHDGDQRNRGFQAGNERLLHLPQVGPQVTEDSVDVDRRSPRGHDAQYITGIPDVNHGTVPLR